MFDQLQHLPLIGATFLAVLAVIVCAFFAVVILMMLTALWSWPPAVPTPRRDRHAMAQQLKHMLVDKHHPIIVDLGSGWGDMLITLAHQFPHARIVGIEWLWLPLLISRWRTRKFATIVHHRTDLYQLNELVCDVVIVPFSHTNASSSRLADHMKRILKPGTLVIAFKFPVSGWRASIPSPRNNAGGFSVNRFYVSRV